MGVVCYPRKQRKGKLIICEELEDGLSEESTAEENSESGDSIAEESSSKETEVDAADELDPALPASNPINSDVDGTIE